MLRLPRFLDATLNFLLPEPCAICGAIVESFELDCLCRECWQLLEHQCRRIGRHDYLCAGWYGALLEQVIRLLKYNHRPGLARGLGQLLATQWSGGPNSGQWIVAPVPLHRSRLRQRGYNQSELLARRFCQLTGNRLAPKLLIRRRATATQAGLSDAQRRQNVRAAFAVRKPELVCGQQILLIDDVITTGATVESCRRALKAAGAASVEVLALARAARW